MNRSRMAAGVFLLTGTYFLLSLVFYVDLNHGGYGSLYYRTGLAMLTALYLVPSLVFVGSRWVGWGLMLLTSVFAAWLSVTLLTSVFRLGAIVLLSLSIVTFVLLVAGNPRTWSNASREEEMLRGGFFAALKFRSPERIGSVFAWLLVALLIGYPVWSRLYKHGIVPNARGAYLAYAGDPPSFWIDEGDSLIYLADGNRLVRYRPSQGSSPIVAKLTYSFYLPTWSPDERLIAAVVPVNTTTWLTDSLLLIDTRSGKTRHVPLAKTVSKADRLLWVSNSRLAVLRYSPKRLSGVYYDLDSNRFIPAAPIDLAYAREPVLADDWSGFWYRMGTRILYYNARRNRVISIDMSRTAGKRLVVRGFDFVTDRCAVWRWGRTWWVFDMRHPRRAPLVIHNAPDVQHLSPNLRWHVEKPTGDKDWVDNAMYVWPFPGWARARINEYLDQKINVR